MFSSEPFLLVALIEFQRVKQAHQDIFNNDKKEGTQLIDKEEVVTKYLVEQEKSDHEVTTEVEWLVLSKWLGKKKKKRSKLDWITFLFCKQVKSPEADEFHEGNEEIKGNDPEGVTKPEDQIEEVCQNIRTSASITPLFMFNSSSCCKLIWFNFNW